MGCMAVSRCRRRHDFDRAPAPSSSTRLPIRSPRSKWVARERPSRSIRNRGNHRRNHVIRYQSAIPPSMQVTRDGSVTAVRNGPPSLCRRTGTPMDVRVPCTRHDTRNGDHQLCGPRRCMKCGELCGSNADLGCRKTLSQQRLKQQMMVDTQCTSQQLSPRMQRSVYLFGNLCHQIFWILRL